MRLHAVVPPAVIVLTLGFCVGSAASPVADFDQIDPAGEPALHWQLAEPGQTAADLMPAPRVGAADQPADVDPGQAPEGDYLGWTAYTPDGGRILLTNKLTDNVTVFDAATMAMITNIPVGVTPGGIATTDDYAVVACGFSDEVYVIDLADYSIAGIFPTGEQPWVVRISPDAARAYVSCDIDDVCEVIDLTTLSHAMTIPGFPIELLSWGFNSENGRTFYEFTDFEVTPDGQHLMVGNRGDEVLFFNTTTGAVDFTVSGVPDCVKLSLSGDGSKAIATNTLNPAQITQIDVASHTVTGTVILSGLSLSMTFDAAVSQDGSKAFVAVSGNQSAIVRFPTSDHVLLGATYTPFWIGVTPDHQYAVGGQYRFSLVSFATESLVGQHAGNAQNFGTVSPVAYEAVGHDPARHEGLYFYAFPSPSAVTYRGTTDAGEYPEGDAPRRVAIDPGCTKAVVTNVLSDNAVVVDLQTYAVEAHLEMGDRVQDVAITPDGLWAVVCCFNSNSIKLVDLTTNTVAAEVATGSRPGVVSLSPDGTRAYVGNISSNTISVVALDGPASYKITDIPCGTIGVVWASFGVSSDVEASPDGAHVLVAASFDDNVKVIDTATNTIVATLPTGDFPIQIAFDGTGDYATVTNAFTDTYTVMRIDGAASYVVGNFTSAGDDYPLRLAYRPGEDQIGIGWMSSKRVTLIDPQTGAIEGYESYATYGSLLGVAFDALDGQSVVLTSSAMGEPGHLHARGEVFPLPAGPAYMTYSGPDAVVPDGREGARVAAVAMPGPDWITFVRWDTSGLEEVATVALSGEGYLHAPQPQPSVGVGRLSFSLARAADVELDLLDVTGRRVAVLARGTYVAGDHEVAYEIGGLAAGVYQAVLRASGRVVHSRTLRVLGTGR